MKKILRKLGIEENFPNLIEAIYQKQNKQTKTYT